MPALTNPRWEQFCQYVAKGQTAANAYVLAGFKGGRGNASTLARKPEIVQRINQIRERVFNIEAAANERAIRNLALTKEALAREWVPLATSNMRNYVAIEQDTGLLQLDFRNVTEDQWKAVKAVQVETRTLARNGEKGTEVAKVKFWLHPKVEAGMAIAQLFGWIDKTRPDPPTPLEQRLRAMTPEQREENAREFVRRVEQRLLEAEASGEVTDGGIGNVAEPTRDTTDEESEDGGA